METNCDSIINPADVAWHPIPAALAMLMILGAGQFCFEMVLRKNARGRLMR